MNDYKFDIPSKAEFIEMATTAKANGRKTLIALPISVVDIQSCDIGHMKKFFENIVSSKSEFRNSVLLSIDGYDEDAREVFEVDEIREYVKKLVKSVPHLLYYVVYDECFSWLMACFANKAEPKRPSNLKPMDAIEASHRKYTLGQNLDMPVQLTMTAQQIRFLTNSIKALGFKIQDTKHTSELVGLIENTFKKE